MEFRKERSFETFAANECLKGEATRIGPAEMTGLRGVDETERKTQKRKTRDRKKTEETEPSSLFVCLYLLPPLSLLSFSLLPSLLSLSLFFSFSLSLFLSFSLSLFLSFFSSFSLALLHSLLVLLVSLSFSAVSL